MVTCKDCIHYDICIFHLNGNENEQCKQFLKTADVVEVVRCKDCKHWGGVTYGQICRKYSGADTKVCTEIDHYCSYGERRGE